MCKNVAPEKEREGESKRALAKANTRDMRPKILYFKKNKKVFQVETNEVIFVSYLIR